jgi:hypothetical protein
MKMKKTQIYIMVSILLSAVVVLLVIFGPRITSPGENVVFIGDEMNLHQDYLIKVVSVDESDTAEILANLDDVEKISISHPDKHYIVVEVSIKRQNTINSKRDHELDINDFKLKDHTGVQIKNIYIQSIKDGTVLSNINFETRNALLDFTWVGKSLNPGEELSIYIYFEVDKNLSVFSDMMILESDFFVGRGDNLGVDVLLASKIDE